MKTNHIVAVVIFLIVVLCLVACATAGRIITEERYGDLTRRVTVLQPGGAVEAATLDQTDPNDKGVTLSASTGARQRVDQVGVRRIGIVTWSGVALCVIGATLIVVRGWFPLIPMSASIATIGVGVALLWLPAVLDQYTWLLLIVAGFVGVLYLTGGIDNWIKLYRNKMPTASTSPPPPSVTGS